MTSTSAPEIPGLRFLRPLGSGGYCDVLLYEQDEPRMKVAVKVLTAPGVSAERRRQFTAEGNAMAALADHPFIVPVFRAGLTAHGHPFLVMQFYPEPNLAQRARHERIPVAEALRIGIQIAGAVETAHRSGILHRDVKPANVLGGPYGNPGLTDFGLAAIIAGPDAPVEGVSVPWAPPEVLGAPPEVLGAPPEVLSAPPEVLSAPPGGSSASWSEPARPDVRGDVYSLAATIWHLLSGRSPFERPGEDNSAAALRDRIVAGQPTPLGRPDVPHSLVRLLRQAMARNPALRPSSALALARGLQRIEQELQLSLTQIVVPSGPRLAEATTTSSTRVRAVIPRAVPPDPSVEAAPAGPVHLHDSYRVHESDRSADTPPAESAAPAAMPDPSVPGAAEPYASPAVTEAAPRYAVWPPPPDGWSVPVLSSAVPASRSRPVPDWAASHRLALLAAAVLLLIVIVAAVGLTR